MSKKINIVLILLAVVVAIVAGIYQYSNIQKQRQQSLEQEQENTVKMPPFASGEVTKIEGNSVSIKGAFEASPEQELMGQVNSETIIVKQIIRNELPTLAHIQISEVKVGDKVVVFYDGRENTSFMITRLQVLD